MGGVDVLREKAEEYLEKARQEKKARTTPRQEVGPCPT